MKFSPQPCISPSESARLGAKQGQAKSAKAAKPTSKLLSHFHTFILSHFPTIQHQEFKIQNCDVPTLTPSSLNPLTPRYCVAAFSLTEVVIAMGVAAVAFTSIIALFPLGLNMSKESYEATQAALIAQTIIGDLSDVGSSQTGGKLIQIKGTNAITANNYINIPMTWNATPVGATADRYIYLAYDQQIRTDSSNSPIMLRPTASFVSLNGPADPNWFTRGTNGPILLVKISIKHSFLYAGPAGTNASANPQRVDVTVESPASAPATNRVQYVFTGIIHQT